MTSAVEDDFGGFVAARWPDLEAVALVAALDPAVAREETALALADLATGWEDALDDGAPTRAARAALLRRLARLDPRPQAPAPVEAPLPVETPTTGGWLATEDSAVPDALLRALHEERPVVRAALAAGVVWGCEDAEVADLADLQATGLAGDLAAARGRLLAAQRDGLARDGLSPADWRLERDLAEVVDALTAAHPDPPDPAALVAERTRGTRRRTLITGGVAAAATVAAGWWLLRGAIGEQDVASGRQTAASLSPDDPRWALTRTWPARGGLADDTGLQALVIRDVGAGGRLVFADDVDGVRVVLAQLIDRPNAVGSSTVLRAWSGPAGTPAEGLEQVPLGLDRIDDAPDVVAVAVPQAEQAGQTRTPPAAAPPTILLVLSRPTVPVASWSPVVHPTAAGSVERTWTLVRMREGVGTLRLDAPPGVAARIQCAGYDGAIPGPPATNGSTTTSVGLPTDEAARRLVASATGVPATELRSEVVLDTAVPGGVLEAYGLAGPPAGSRLRVALTVTPDGGRVRTIALRQWAYNSDETILGAAVVIPASDVDEPVVRRIDIVPPRTMRFLVVAPGAARCQLLAVTPAAYPLSKVVPVSGDAALVPVVNGQDAGSYRLVLWDADGRRIYSGVPNRGRELLDLGQWY